MKTEKYRILIVDDEKQYREELKDIFEEEFDIATAENGEEALKKLQVEEFDVAIVDLKMPVMDGLSLIRKIDEQELDTYVVILTGHGDKDDAVQALRLQEVVKDWFDKSNTNTELLFKRVKHIAEGMPFEEIIKITSKISARELKDVI